VVLSFVRDISRLPSLSPTVRVVHAIAALYILILALSLFVWAVNSPFPPPLSLGAQFLFSGAREVVSPFLRFCGVIPP